MSNLYTEKELKELVGKQTFLSSYIEMYSYYCPMLTVIITNEKLTLTEIQKIIKFVEQYNLNLTVRAENDNIEIWFSEKLDKKKDNDKPRQGWNPFQKCEPNRKWNPHIACAYRQKRAMRNMEPRSALRIIANKELKSRTTMRRPQGLYTCGCIFYVHYVRWEGILLCDFVSEFVYGIPPFYLFEFIRGKWE